MRSEATRSVPSAPPRLTVISPTQIQEAAPDRFAQLVRAGLSSEPKTLPCQYFYDEVGSQLFEQICELPEYYPTRTEDAILRDHAEDMVDGWLRAPDLVELGSGSSTKTRRLIDAALRRYGSLHYIPIDVSPTILQESAESLIREFPGLRVTGFACDYQTALPRIADRFPGPKLFVFLGSSLGNYETDAAVDLLGQLAAVMDGSDQLLLGTDLVKDPATLECAYDDAQGVTARFNLNLLERINRELGGEFDLDRFTHRAVYRADRERVEMHLESRAEQVVRIRDANLTVRFREGETIHTENSHKYTPQRLQELARRSGFGEEGAWTDPEGWFRVQRWRPVG